MVLGTTNMDCMLVMGCINHPPCILSLFSLIALFLACKIVIVTRCILLFVLVPH